MPPASFPPPRPTPSAQTFITKVSICQVLFLTYALYHDYLFKNREDRFLCFAHMGEKPICICVTAFWKQDKLMYMCINRNARLNNNQLSTYYKRAKLLTRIHTIPR